MCGIFGIVANDEKYKKKYLLKIVEDLAKLSQVRGKDSSGIAYRFESENLIEVLRGPVSIDDLLQTNEYKILKKRILTETKTNSDKIFAALGHARLVTNGSQLEDNNNQPVIKDGIIGVHNGIIVNQNELWNKHFDLKRNYEIDTEILLALIRKYFSLPSSPANKTEVCSCGIVSSVLAVNSELFGTVSTGLMFNDCKEFVVFTNNGSLYTLTNYKDIFVYGSEKNILNKLINKNRDLCSSDLILKQVPANKGFLISYTDFKVLEFDIKEKQENYRTIKENNVFEINVTNYRPLKKQLHAVLDPRKFTNSIVTNSEKKLLEYNVDRISKLKRCNKCILPETFPFIEFDENGICNYCNNYINKNQPKPIEKLIELIAPFKRKDGQPDCLVPFSGGRDSTFTLHIVKNVLNMNPIAFTYDWGMVTDLGRRNIARVTGKMGVENIIVSADIKKKRNNIRKNVTAWLKNPELGMVPLFMAGDKYFFYYTNKVCIQNGLDVSFWGSNPMENTDFKTGFCGIAPKFEKSRIDMLNKNDKLKLIKYFGKNYINNLTYLNSSLIDTLGSFFSRYLIKRHGYFQLFDYIEWSESEIEELILNEYKWEIANDTKTTWRIGDGTAAFYNYIYYTIAGFSEYETFRSNQVREGMVSREFALQKVYDENLPRYESLKWYLEIIGMEFKDVIKKINNTSKLY